jgi:sugar phosphate isomerase/epimerase
MIPDRSSRRSFLALSAMLPWALRSRASTFIPVGLELYSVREALKRDPFATVRAVAQLGYECVEFYAPYFDWSDSDTKKMRKLMDDLGIRCYSTHNDESFLKPGSLEKARDKNLTLGCKYLVLSSSKLKTTLDEWKGLADSLNVVADKLEPSGLRVGCHNHQVEFRPIQGQRPIEVLAKSTKPSILLQLDVGTCIEAGSDPVAWIRSNPGRIRSIHCKDWSPEPGKGYTVLFGEGVADWKKIFEAAESAGGVEYYLVEQEGSRLSEIETARTCLKTFREKHSA